MTSVLNVDTIADKAGTGPVGLTKQHAAKAWVDFDGSGASYNASFNTSSSTDNGTGDYTFSLSNSMDSTNYAGITDGLNTANNNFDVFMHTQAAGSFSAKLRIGDSGSDTDKETYAVVHGDLA